MGVLIATGCSDDDPPASDPCDASALPLVGVSGAPTLTEATLECQGSIINVLITATDPEGDADLIDVVQTVGVFRDPNCASAVKQVTDDLAGSGLEESFGIVFSSDTDADVFAAICGSSTWPIEVLLADAGGHLTAGRVRATVIH